MKNWKIVSQSIIRPEINKFVVVSAACLQWTIHLGKHVTINPSESRMVEVDSPPGLGCALKTSDLFVTEKFVYLSIGQGIYR